MTGPILPGSIPGVPIQPAGATPADVARALVTTPSPASGLASGNAPIARNFGVVVSIQVGSPTTLTLTLSGSAVAVAGVRFLSSYTPLVNDTVVVETSGPDNIVLGNLAGVGVSNGVPAGAIQSFAMAAPVGWLLCDGTSYATATYPALFAAIAYTWGGGGASFNVPDLRGRSQIAAGAGSGLTARSLAQTGGEENHILSLAELASHGHNHSHGSHVHNHTHGSHSHSHGHSTGTDSVAHHHNASAGNYLADGAGSAFMATAGAFGPYTVLASTSNESADHSHTANTDATGATPTADATATTPTADATASGSNTSHNNMQPYAVLTVCIKA